MVSPQKGLTFLAERNDVEMNYLSSQKNENIFHIFDQIKVSMVPYVNRTYLSINRELLEITVPVP